MFYEKKQGLPQALAHGLRVNATDLKWMKYQSRDALIQLGKWAVQQDALTQAQIDAQPGTLTS